MTRSARSLVSSCAVSLFLFALIPSPSQAQSQSETGISYRGWGPRVGVSTDPDQVFVGAHWDLGEFTERLRFRPNAQIGFGDDQILFSANAAALWYFSLKGNWSPYVGGELGIVYQDFDNKKNDTDIALNAVGGIETGLKNNRRFLLELKLGLAADPDVQLLAGWTF